MALLFQDDNHQPLNFYITPGPHRKNLKNLIETHGGKITLNPHLSKVCLWSKKSKYSNSTHKSKNTELVLESYITESISKGILLDKKHYYLNKETLSHPPDPTDDFENVKLQRNSKIDHKVAKNDDAIDLKPPTLNELLELDILAENILNLLIVNHEMDQTAKLDNSLHISKLDEELSELTGNQIFWAVFDNKVLPDYLLIRKRHHRPFTSVSLYA
jgi:hypothetical protein